MARRGQSGLSGILLVDKPAGLTSHDVVNAVRHAVGERRVGHAGTLDPMATGLLVMLVGPATRLAPYLQPAAKSYVARIVFGIEMDTDDAEGEAVRTTEVPASLMDESVASEAVSALVGTHQQVPPSFSAIKRGGTTAHRAARAGAPIEVEAREITIAGASLLAVDPGPPVSWDLVLDVSKGTFIRAIARDLGRDLDTAAHLGALRRTRSGPLGLESSHTLDDVRSAGSAVGSLFADPVAALGMPVLQADDAAFADVKDGRPLSLEAPAGADDRPFAVAAGGRLLGIYRSQGGTLRAEIVLPGGVTGGMS